MSGKDLMPEEARSGGTDAARHHIVTTPSHYIQGTTTQRRTNESKCELELGVVQLPAPRGFYLHDRQRIRCNNDAPITTTTTNNNNNNNNNNNDHNDDDDDARGTAPWRR